MKIIQIFFIFLLLDFISNYNIFKKIRFPKNIKSLRFNKIENENYPNFEIVKSENDLSVFNLENAKTVIQGVRNGNYRGENEIIMYDKNNYVQTNQYGYEFQINENFEVISEGINVQLLPNGYILSGHTEGAKTIREKVKIGNFLIFIRETNSIYVFENKKEYKYAFYLFKINSYL